MIIGSEACVPVLKPMLTKDEKSADWARYALEGIPGDAVDKALIRAAADTSGRARIGILNSLGNRKSKAAVKTLARFTKNRDKAVASAAIAALGQIGGDDATDAVAKRARTMSRTTRTWRAQVSISRTAKEQGRKFSMN